MIKDAMPCSVANTHNQTTVVVVAPLWLQEALYILLQAGLNITPMVDMDAYSRGQRPPLLLLFLTGEQYSVKEETVCSVVRQIKQIFPMASVLVLVEEAKQEAEVRVAGADVVLLLGVSSQRLLNAIKCLLYDPRKERMAT